MAGKLHELKETTGDAINFIRELRDPEVQRSLENIKAISNTVNEIVAILKDPQFAKNIDNLNSTASSIRESALALQNTTAELNRAGTLDELTRTIRSVRALIDSFGDVQTKGGMIVSLTNLVVSLKQVLEETHKLRKAHDAQEPTPAIVSGKP